MSTKINPRWLRKGRVAYREEGDFAVLIKSPSPGRWLVGDSTGMVIHRESAHITSRYEKLLTSTSSIPNTPRNNSTLENMGKTLLLSKNADVEALGKRLVAMAATRESGMAAGAVAAVKATVTPVSRAVSGFSVQPYDPDSFWYESAEDESLYEDFITMRQNHHPVNLLIAGPSGSGKTEGIQHLGKKKGIPVHIVNCQAITTPEKWIGQMQADTEQGTYFVPSQHIQWVERTHPDCEGFDYCILLYDEITRLRAELNNMTYSLFDTQKGLEVPQMGRRVIMASENMIVATANIGSAFTGTHTQDRAFRERFSITMERGFAPEEAEVKILTSATGIDVTKAKELVKVAAASRRLWENDEIESPISTRVLKAWSLLVAGNYSVKQAAEHTVIPLYSNDGGTSSDRTRIAGLIEGKVV